MSTQEQNTPTKDKTFYIEHNGQMVRVRASKKPSKKTTEALKAMIVAIQNRESKHP